MKAKQQKICRKNLLFYKNHFNFKPPYSVLIDGTFCKAALQFKINIMEQLPKYLDAEVKYFTTSCVLAECEALGTLLYGPLKVLKQFQVQPCRHKLPKPATKCLRDVMRHNKHKFFIATQDPEFREKIQTLSGVPLIFIAYNTMLLESPGDMSKDIARLKQDRKHSPSEFSIGKLKELKRETFGTDEESVIKKKRKKIKEANPLSCKKKKKRTAEELNELKKKKKRKKVKKSKMTLEKLAAGQT